MTRINDLLATKGSRVWSIEPEDPVLEALQLMADRYIGALPVMRGTELVGIISERDYARKVVLMGRSSSETPVWQIMSAPVVTIAPDDTVEACMALMTERRIRHLSGGERRPSHRHRLHRRPRQGRHRGAAADDRRARAVYRRLSLRKPPRWPSIELPI